MNKILKVLPIFFVLFYYGQQNYFIVTVDKMDKNYPNEHPLYYWIIDLSNKDNKIAPLYFWKVENEEKEYCSKYNEINVFSEDPKVIGIDKIENKINKNRTNVLNIKRMWLVGRNKKPTNFKVFITPISGNIFSCNINQREGEKINYQGKVYLMDENFRINKDLLKTDIDKLELLNWINFNFVKTYPYNH